MQQKCIHVNCLHFILLYVNEKSIPVEIQQISKMISVGTMPRKIEENLRICNHSYQCQKQSIRVSGSLTGKINILAEVCKLCFC